MFRQPFYVVVEVFVTLFLGPAWSVGADKIRLSSETVDKRYQVVVTDSEFAKSPQWKADQESPPLPARRAMALAEKIKNRLVKDSKEWKWELESASLRDGGDSRWYWLIEYKASWQKDASRGHEPAEQRASKSSKPAQGSRP